MTEQPKAWTFAALTGRMPPFFMVRRRRRWCEKVLAVKELEGVVSALLLGPVLIVYMETENDAIIAKNRLRFIGVPVSEETYETDRPKLGVFASDDYVNQEDGESGTE